jgi:hypothetical protein
MTTAAAPLFAPRGPRPAVHHPDSTLTHRTIVASRVTQTLRPLAFAALFCAIIPLAAAAQAPPANEPAQPLRFERVIRDQLAGSINEPGLQHTLELYWTRRLSRSTNVLLADAHFSAGLVSVTTPAEARLGVWFEYSPLSILDIRAGAEPSVYFGTFDSVQSFATYSDAFDRKTREARDDATSATGSRAYLSPALKMKVGPIAARVGAEFERWSSSATGPLFYEPTRDTLLKTRGGYLWNLTTVAMYQHDYASGGLFSGGLIHDMTTVFDAPGNRSQRLGLIGIHEFGAKQFGLPHLRVTAIVWRHIQDPSKHNQWGGALAIGFRTRK